MLAGTVALGVWFFRAPGIEGQTALIIATALTGVLGVHLGMAIGGADMPVVVSMLNSYSGWTAAAAGFMLGNDLLIIHWRVGWLQRRDRSYIMCVV